MKLSNFLRPARLIAGLALVLGTSAFSTANAAIVYQFSGTCTTGCAGTTNSTVSVIDTYVPGSLVNLSDLITIDYTSSDFSYTITAPLTVGGGSVLPVGSGATLFDVADGTYEFRTFADGSWDASMDTGKGYQVVDAGNAGSFNPTPEPSSVLMIGGGVAALAALRRRKA